MYNKMMLGLAVIYRNNGVSGVDGMGHLATILFGWQYEMVSPRVGLYRLSTRYNIMYEGAEGKSCMCKVF